MTVVYQWYSIEDLATETQKEIVRINGYNDQWMKKEWMHKRMKEWKNERINAWMRKIMVL